MKKLILIGLLVSSTSAFAQAVAPTPPSPPNIVTTSPNETDANSVATTNKVYLDQDGNNVNVNIVQTGSANVIGNAANPVTLIGDNQEVIAIQTGNTNSLFMNLTSNTGALGIAKVTVRQLGDSNSATINCGNAQTDASCNQLDMNMKFTGNSNAMTYHGSGANIRNSMDVSGNNNTFVMDALSPNASQTILLTGSYNTFNTSQTGLGGTYGHSLYVNMTGTGNTVTTQQYGASETVINVTSVGSNGTFNIKTGH